MIPTTQQHVVGTEDSRLYRAIALTDVGGGLRTDPLTWSTVQSEEFRQALRRALEAHGYLSSEPVTAQFQLTAFIIGASHPLSGVHVGALGTATVVYTVHYTLTNRVDGNSVLDEAIESAGTATGADALIGFERLRMAKERAIRASISDLLARLRYM